MHCAKTKTVTDDAPETRIVKLTRLLCLRRKAARYKGQSKPDDPAGLNM
jgi:hypothetical protein